MTDDHIYPQGNISEMESTIEKWIKANTEHQQWYICPKCSYQAPRFKDEWKDLTTAEVKALWSVTKKPSEFADLLQAKLRERNA
jgi:hypothetical protein